MILFFLPFEISANSNGRHLGWRMEGGSVTHNFENGSSFWAQDFNVIFSLKICIIGINRLKG
jgi:hypothetical protein